MGFEVGKEVVALESQEKIREGEVYLVNGVMSFCKHIPIILSLVIAGDVFDGNSYCEECNRKIKGLWYASKRFKPLDDIDVSELMDELTKEPFSK
jgi:hypothetical protein